MYSAENRKTLDHVNKKWVRVLTVITYVISVSVVALILGLYYKLAWNPNYDTDNQSSYNIQRHVDLSEFNVIPLGKVDVIANDSSKFDQQKSLDGLKSKIMNVLIDHFSKSQSDPDYKLILSKSLTNNNNKISKKVPLSDFVNPSSAKEEGSDNSQAKNPANEFLLFSLKLNLNNNNIINKHNNKNNNNNNKDNYNIL
jgi:hypothetical protein